MVWTELLTSEIEKNFKAVDGLLGLVDEKELGWKPSAGSNWMTMGQLLRHMGSACGMPALGFVTGEWGGAPADSENEGMQGLPPAEKYKPVADLADARARLAADKARALEAVAKAGEQRLATEKTKAPWDPTEHLLGYMLLQMTQHLGSHKSQLYYYLKLQGKPVNTMHLWGM